METLRFEEILTRKRECDPTWLIRQAECLARFAKEKGSATALIYAAIEARNAIEQLVFQLIVLAAPVKDQKLLDDCRSQQGLYSTLMRVQPNIEKLARFSSILAPSCPGAPPVVELDREKLREFRNRLGKYCHFQGSPHDTTDAPFDVWLAQGIALVEEVYGHFRDKLSGGMIALIRLHECTPAGRQMWEDYLCGKLTDDDLRRRVAIVQASNVPGGLRLPKPLG